MIAAGELGAAARECVEHPNCRRFRGRRRGDVGPDELQTGPRHRSPAQRTEMLNAEVVDVGVSRVRTLWLVVAADAEVAVRKPRQVVAESQRLIERARVIHLSVDEQAVARRGESKSKRL